MNHFVAFPLALPALDARLDASPPPEGLRRFAPEDRHVTVAFLGPCGPERAQAAWRAVASLPLPTFDVELGAVMPMGNPRRYSALAALVAGSEPFTAWSIRAREIVLRAAELPEETRVLRPHATLARPTRRADESARAEGLAWARALDVRGLRARLDRLGLYGWSADRARRLFVIEAERAAD